MYVCVTFLYFYTVLPPFVIAQSTGMLTCSVYLIRGQYLVTVTKVRHAVTHMVIRIHDISLLVGQP